MAARLHSVAELTRSVPGVIPGILLFLTIGARETMSTGHLSTGALWVFSEDGVSTPVWMLNFRAFESRTCQESGITGCQQTGNLHANEYGIYPAEYGKPSMDVQLNDSWSVVDATLPAAGSPKRPDAKDSVDELPTAIQVFIIFGFLSVHQLITFSVFNLLLAFKVIQDDNLIVAYAIDISISGFFCLVLLAGDPFMKAILLTLSYFTCVTLFLGMLVFLVKQQARWHVRADR